LTETGTVLLLVDVVVRVHRGELFAVAEIMEDFLLRLDRVIAAQISTQKIEVLDSEVVAPISYLK
jgi:hypothetical protein